MHCMIDLETMSTRPNAAILSIGAVEMDLRRFEFGRTFYQNVELSSCLEVGLHESVATRDWWAVQQPEARDALTKDAVGIVTALANFRNWLRNDSDLENRELLVWGNGASFDITILESAHVACGLEIPWKFFNVMCYRTLKVEHRDVDMPPRIGLKHNALDDAKTQAMHLFQIVHRKKPHIVFGHRSFLQRLSDAVWPAT